MGRAPCCEKDSVKRGPWTPEEDAKLLACVAQHGTGSWRTLPKKAGLQRCGKSCRLRWTNYLRPDLKHGRFSDHEEQTIVKLHAALGSRWSLIAAQLPGRTDNDVKNYWNTRLKKKLCEMGIDPITHKPISQLLADLAGSMGTLTPAGQPNMAAGGTALAGRTIADAALGCFKDDMLNVIMRRHPSTNAMSGGATPSGPSAAASCTSSPTATNAALERPNLQPLLNTPQFLQVNSTFRRQLPFALSQGFVGGGQGMVGGGMQGIGGGGVLGGNAPMQPGILPPCLRFLNPAAPPSPLANMSPSPYHPFLPSASQQPAKSMIDMLLDSNTNHTVTSSSSTATLISGVMPSCFNRGMNEGASSVKIQLGTATSVHVEQNYSLSTQSAISSETDKFLASQADLQAHIAEPNPWFNTQEEEEEEEEGHPQDKLEEEQLHENSLLNHTHVFNWATEASSLYAHARSSRGDTNNMLAWSPTCTSRSSSTCSNFLGPSETTIPSHNIIDQPPLTSVDAMLWDLSDLHAFIS